MTLSVTALRIRPTSQATEDPDDDTADRGPDEVQRHPARR